MYDHAGILHRDVGPNNIMYRKLKGKVHGVLADYDLASLRSTLTLDRTKTSHQRTGTPPFMAHGLLDGSDLIHLYRHDLESLFYTMLILATHHEIPAPGEENGGIRVLEEGLHFQDWFETTNYKTLSGAKSDFFTKLPAFEPSPSFADFHGWLRSLRKMFNRGFIEKIIHKSSLEYQEPGDEEMVPPFDDETLGGYVTYSTLIQTARNLAGKLRGLAIRYDPLRTSSSVVTNAVRAHT